MKRMIAFSLMCLLASPAAHAQGFLTQTRTPPADTTPRNVQPGVADLNTIIRSLAPINRPGQDIRQAIDLDIRFRIGSAELSPDATIQLGELGMALVSETLANAKIEIAGHTDATGPADLNKRLSLARAISVKTYLVETFDMDPERLTTVGWGSEKLKDPENPASGVNRRVEITNLGRPQASPAATGTRGGDGIKFR
ncbi:MAG: hypothetical protein A2018_07635 [Alphaproteobacteria bacterium GWF2_58_20]|nr:MAG: hypothetical protein A2018_07635 [Alphaproteobacteria bacterium GWF2_58_20]